MEREDLSGRRLVIVGFARQGMALARYGAEHGAEVIVTDLRSADQLRDGMDALQDLEISYVLGEHPLTLLQGTDMVAVSGGVPVDIPLIRAARAQGIAISNDSHEFMKRCPAPVIGITGSAGKTTTTALLGEMSRAAGKRTWVGGNIGRPLIADLEEMRTDDLVIQELSSFQLELWQQSPPVAAVLNITPNHLDRHGTMDAYRSAKANIIRFQNRDGIAVLAADDDGAMSLLPLVTGRMRQFSIEHEVADGAFIREDVIWLRQAAGQETAVIPTQAVQLRGRHNLLNVCAAVALADSAGIPTTAMAEAIAAFRGEAHRLELVDTIQNVAYVNDSIATAPERALAALASFDEPLILLAGGKDKQMVWDEWARYVSQHVKQVILFGDLAPLLEVHLQREKAAGAHQLQVTRVDTLAAAVELAAQAAQPGDVVLLSPGGTSYDAYQDFEERGRHFRALVSQLDRFKDSSGPRKAQ